MAGLLCLCWSAIGLLLLLSAQAGAAEPLLAIGALLSAGLCLLAARRSPAPPAGGAARLPLGLLALLLSLALLPVAADAAGPSAGPASLLAPDGAYALATAVFLTALYAGMQLGPPRRALLLAGAFTALPLLLVGTALAAMGGHADVPGGCLVPAAGDHAQVLILASAGLDDRAHSSATLEGARSSTNERWSGVQQGAPLASRSVEFVRVGDEAWLRGAGGGWSVTDPPLDAAGGTATLDVRLLSMLEQQPAAAFEDLGIALVRGQPARHCRVATDGISAVDAFLPLGWLLGGGPLESSGQQLSNWRGELDWWVGGGGRLVRAEVFVGGHPGDAWQEAGLRGRLQAQLSVEEPATAPFISEPLP
ncbi:hypothetical protein BH24CHL6_BH24CHL6_12460 [soil metagenome]